VAREAHPDEMVTASYLDGSLTARARDEVEAHLAECDTCRAGVTLLGSLPSEESVPHGMMARARALGDAGDAVVPGARFRSPAMAWATAAAALIVLAAASMTWMTWMPRALVGAESGAAAPVYRGTPDAAGSAFGAVSPARGAVVPAGSLAFSWSAVPGADRYTVTVLDARGTTLTTLDAPAGATTATWRPETPPAGDLLWKVKAWSLDRVLDETRPVAFTVK